MEKKFRVELARQVFNNITSYGTVTPMALNNACELLGIGKDPRRKNYLLMYFMTKEVHDVYNRSVELTPREFNQMEYIRKHMNEDLTEYIRNLNNTHHEDEFNPNTVDSLDVLFTAADTDDEVINDMTMGSVENLDLQSHSEDKLEVVQQDKLKPKTKRGPKKKK